MSRNIIGSLMVLVGAWAFLSFLRCPVKTFWDLVGVILGAACGGVFFVLGWLVLLGVL